MSEKIKQVIAYICPVVGGLVFLLLDSSSEETKYHSAQALVIGVILTVFSFIPIVQFFVWIACIIFLILGVVKAINEENPKLPFIGDIVDGIWKDKFSDLRNNEEKTTKKVKPEDVKTSEK